AHSGADVLPVLGHCNRALGATVCFDSLYTYPHGGAEGVVTAPGDLVFGGPGHAGGSVLHNEAASSLPGGNRPLYRGFIGCVRQLSRCHTYRPGIATPVIMAFMGRGGKRGPVFGQLGGGRLARAPQALQDGMRRAWTQNRCSGEPASGATP